MLLIDRNRTSKALEENIRAFIKSFNKYNIVVNDGIVYADEIPPTHIDRIQFDAIVVCDIDHEYYDNTPNTAHTTERPTHYASTVQGTQANSGHAKRLRNKLNHYVGLVPPSNLLVFDMTSEQPTMDRPFIDYVANKDTDGETYNNYDLALWKRATSLDYDSIRAYIEWDADMLIGELNPNWIICPHCGKPAYFNPLAEVYTTSTDYSVELEHIDSIHCEHCESLLTK